MKSLDGVNKKNDVNNTASEAPEKNVKTESEKIDFSKVKVEPLFEEFVDFDTFSKSDFRAVKVKECVAVPKSKKLLQFTLDDGTGTDRTILSGIHAYYEPEELVGKTLIAITNLPPRAMMGIDSCGISFNSDGTTTFFAQLEKSSASQKEYLEKLQEKKAAEKKEAKKKEQSKQTEVRKTTVQANSKEELLDKIKNIDWDSIKPEENKIGGRFDFSI